MDEWIENEHAWHLSKDTNIKNTPEAFKKRIQKVE